METEIQTYEPVSIEMTVDTGERILFREVSFELVCKHYPEDLELIEYVSSTIAEYHSAGVAKTHVMYGEGFGFIVLSSHYVTKEYH